MGFNLSGILTFLTIFVIIFATILSLFTLLTKSLEITFRNCSLEQCVLLSSNALQKFFENANLSNGINVSDKEISFLVSAPDGKAKEYKFLVIENVNETLVRLYLGEKYYNIVSIPNVISIQFDIRENLPIVKFLFNNKEREFILTSNIST
ncbi:hypothetical protein SU69_02305 [Thermosipho melanesiensis]|uniref:Uncharacterized protein n=2 Tax=Thermosipho melanesiensis TaxID=46541 RepID=A6LK60_THEM4|nr:hypothetical protein [Thermosipho melanesiensis]ABR30311.1 hypothetical protein Tmel_0444 [Thermosipho melanesiensis BI429]APT74825.1 hypothetical protein BW47_02410 [Thermosipho melanesiensis]OOC37433.1 hypothetical protein SU68_02315 [Thermosipho melanesiensis]OOC39795.1 hypothetical protein SU69_02305 [Thermosipho melanesiensis]OOC39900.1 hypothetical protein SU70_02300 [Thermosipho melanesiensis]